MELSKRLHTIAKQVPQGSKIADIGTDHGYVPIYLYEENRIQNAIACDINKGPLQKAKENIMSYGAEKVIEPRLGNGLENISPDEVNVIIIAGMGGMLIIDILNQKLELTKSMKRLILQPQLDQAEVRKYLHTIGFQIIDEEMLMEDGKYYTVITAEPGEEKYDHPYHYLFGEKLISKKDPILKKYIAHQLQQLETIIEHLQEVKTDQTSKRLVEVKQQQKQYREVLMWL